MNGGKLGRLGRNRIEDLAYYYDNLKKYVENVNQSFIYLKKLT